MLTGSNDEMPTDCLYNQCDFFLWDRESSCPACGHTQIVLEVRQTLRSPWILVALGLTSGLLLALLVRAVGPLGTTAVFLFLGILLAAAAHRAGKHQQTATRTSLDYSYQDALHRATQSLERWTHLHSLQHGSEPFADDEHVLLSEAESVIEVVAAKEVARCKELGARYVHNALERLAFLAQERTPLQEVAHAAEHDRAVAILEHYLEKWWIDAALASTARTLLDQHQRDRRSESRRDLVLQAVAPISLFADGVESIAPDGVAGHRRRLRIERELHPDV